MVSSYYLYSYFIAGFFPRSYAQIWGGFTLVSPVLAYICWYAKGRGKLAVSISAGIIAVLYNTAFSYGFFYFGIRYELEVVVLIIAVWVLRRAKWEMIAVIGLGIVFANIMNLLVPSMLW
jgi:hypothetical protein